MQKLLFSVLLALCACPAAAKSYISLTPATTEILFALKANSVSAVSNFCDYPPQAKALPKAGDMLAPAIERIAALRPDIVFTGKWVNDSTARRLQRLGIKVIEVPQQKSVEDIYSSITLIGENTDRRAEAAKLIAGLRKTLAAIKKRGRKVRVYIELDNPHWTAGGASYINELIEDAGGENIFSDVKKDYFSVSWEETAKRAPQIIINLTGGKKEYQSGARVIDNLDRNEIIRPTPRAIRAAGKLADALHD